MDRWEPIFAALNSLDAAMRKASARRLVLLCEKHDDAPCDVIFDRLMKCGSNAPRVEPDDSVLDALQAAAKHVAHIRVARNGFGVIPPANLEDAEVLQWIWEVAVYWEDRAVFKASIDAAPAGLVGMYAMWFSNSEICNGGFNQYFYNSTGILMPDALAGLRRFGATATLAIFEEVASLFPWGVVSTDRGERIRQLDALAEPSLEHLKTLDQRYYALVDDDHWTAAARRYVASHPDEFFVSSVPSRTRPD